MITRIRRAASIVFEVLKWLLAEIDEQIDDFEIDAEWSAESNSVAKEASLYKEHFEKIRRFIVVPERYHVVLLGGIDRAMDVRPRDQQASMDNRL